MGTSLLFNSILTAPIYTLNTVSFAEAGQMDLESLFASLISDTAREKSLAVLKAEEVMAQQIISGEVSDEVPPTP
jgi:hypothetical protein